MTRAEHLQWAKTRALAYVTHGDLPNAFTSMLSDLRKHPQTFPEAAEMQLWCGLYANRHLDTPERMREWINGFN